MYFRGGIIAPETKGVNLLPPDFIFLLEIMLQFIDTINHVTNELLPFTFTFFL